MVSITFTHKLRTSSSSHGIACSGDGDGGDDNSNSDSNGGGDDNGGGGDSDGGGHRQSDNRQQSTKSGNGRRGGGDGGSDTRTTAATATADGTVMVIAVTAMTAAAVARGGDGCGGVFWRRRAVAKGRQKIAKANWQFHLPVRHRVFDAVVKHGWPSARCHGTNNMAEKKIKITPLSNIVRGQNFLKVIKLAQSSIKKWAHICAHKGR